MKKTSPTFQQSGKTFRERSAGEKFATNAPHFNTNNNRAFPPTTSTERTTTLKSASGKTGTVQVRLKSSANEEAREKKTGPLSPRAPEKIKKNRSEEMKVYGENACQALFEQRPESIVRIWANVEMAKKSGALLSYLAENKKVYHVVDNQELTLVSGSEHHGGICMLVKKPRPLSLTGYLALPHKQDCLVLIDDIKNAHNLGGLLRTCAIFSVNGVIFERAFTPYLNASAAMRVAEGGMEYVHKFEADSLELALQQLRQAGYQIVHLTQQKQGKPLTKLHLADKVVFVLNEQGEAPLAHAEDEQIRLTLSNPLNANLNVAVAAGILLAKWNGDFA